MKSYKCYLPEGGKNNLTRKCTMCHIINLEVTGKISLTVSTKFTEVHQYLLTWGTTSGL